ncbi:MAG: class II fructose-bisphosphate aldolase [Candidatus Vogelbacteria bacterium]|nr:class II fructose-bisphosphate aldolase [Candidatus Vogelbacteria bacterium]
MITLREAIKDAEKKKVAIGHFNISTIDQLWAVFNSARNLNVPVTIGVSEKERDFIGVSQAVHLVESIRDEFSYPIFINADHTYSFERVKEAIDLGYDSAIFDGAKLPLEENIKITKQCVDYARAVAEKEERETLVEGELGYIGSSSKILDAIPEGASIGLNQLTTVEDAERFVTETGVDLFSPAIGSIHGQMREGYDPDINIQRLSEIQRALNAHPVLHGGSGLKDENFTKGIAVGLLIVHISTEIRVAWRKALMTSLAENPDEIAPYKLLANSVKAVEEVVTKKLKLFNGIS